MSELSRNEAAIMAAQMSNALAEQGCVPLFLVGGKEKGGGFRDYAIAGDLDREYVTYVLRRILMQIDGTAAKEAESN